MYGYVLRTINKQMLLSFKESPFQSDSGYYVSVEMWDTVGAQNHMAERRLKVEIST